MEKQGKKIKDTVENIVKPVSTMVEKFNYFMRKLEEKAFAREKIETVDGFVTDLLEELQDVEQGIFAFFTELLFMHHMTERMTEIENEVTLSSILGEHLKESVHPAFIEIFLQGESGMLFSGYSHPYEKKISQEQLRHIAEDVFSKGESVIYNNKNISGITFSVLAIPLRTTKEKYGAILIAREAGSKFSSESMTVAIAGSAVVSFMITNIKLMQKMIKNEKLVMIGQTIGELSHDARNFLNNLENGITLVDMGVHDNDRESLDIGLKVMKSGYEKLKNFVLSMVEYSKEREIYAKEIDINQLIESLISTHFELYRQKRVKIKTQLDRRIGKVYLDPGLMERLIVNLVQNGLDAVENDNGEVIIGTDLLREEKVLSLWVADNGCGIPAEQLERIFDIFYSTKGSRGTGFGLAIVEKIVKAHNGKIETETEIGKGTKFTIRIPV